MRSSRGGALAALALIAAGAGVGGMSMPGQQAGNVAQAIQQGASNSAPTDKLPNVSTRAEIALRQLFRGSGGPARITYRKRPHLSRKQHLRADGKVRQGRTRQRKGR